MNQRYHTNYVFTQLEEAYQTLTNHSGKQQRRDSG
jgi:hypothetical protein